VSELLKVPTSTIYALCRERRIPHLRVGRRIVFERAALMDWVRAHLVETA
jgi:excisionase family DNA binding protein